MTPVAKRVMALLVGLHFQEAQRMDRARLARAVKRSERTVKRALSELQSLGWIQCCGGGNGTPGTIRVINDKAWIMARVSRNGPGLGEDGPGLAQNGPGLPRIRSLEVLQGKESALPFKPVENHHAEMWEQLDRFCAENDITIQSGADIDQALRLMQQRKPPTSEWLSRSAAAGRS
jgi:hypothetical protein